MAEGRHTLVLDASVLINFLGSGCVEVILGSLSDRVLMAERTFNEVLRDPSGRMPAAAQRRALVDRGLIIVAPLDHVGNQWFLDLVSEPDALDDGEAAEDAVADGGGRGRGQAAQVEGVVIGGIHDGAQDGGAERAADHAHRLEQRRAHAAALR